MLWGKKKERRKNFKLRQEIDDHNKAVEDVRELAKEVMMATINGDLKWMKRSAIVEAEEENGDDRCSCSGILDNSC